MPEFGEIKELDCGGKCRKKTSHVFTETREFPYSFKGKVIRGWQCTGCKRLVVVQKLPAPDEEQRRQGIISKE